MRERGRGGGGGRGGGVDMQTPQAGGRAPHKKFK